MDVYSWVIFMYVAGTMIVGWLLLVETNFLNFKKREKLVGPTYWGAYTDCAVSDLAGEKTIRLHDIPNDEEAGGLCGGSGYSGGKAVKSARV